MKKFISILLVGGLLSLDVGSCFAAATTTARATATQQVPATNLVYDDGDSFPTYTQSKLAKMQPKVLSHMRKVTEKTVARFTSTTKIGYKKLLVTKIQEVTNLFNEGREYSYFSSYMEEYLTNQIVAKVAEFNDLVAEMNQAPNDIKPFVLTKEDRANVESNIITIQKDLLVPLIEKALKNYKESDLKGSGEFHTSFEDKDAKFTLDINRYTSILAIMTFSQEVDFAGKLTYSLQLPTMGTYDEESGKYTPGKKETASGAINADMNVKMIDDKMYLQIKDLSVEINNAKAMGMSADEMTKFQKTIGYMKWKTFVTDIPKGETMNSAKVLAQIAKTVEVLSSNALLTPGRKTADGFALKFNENTIKKIAGIYTDEPVSRGDLNEMNAGLNLFYASKDGSVVLTQKLQNITAYGSQSLTQKNGNYTYVLNLDGRGATNNGNTLDITATKNTFFLTAHTATTNANIEWQNETLLARVTQGDKEIFKANGKLSENKADLSFSAYGKAIGDLSWEIVGNQQYTYSFSLAPNETSEIFPQIFTFSLKAKEYLETGKFPISTPTNATPMEELEKLTKDL